MTTLTLVALVAATAQNAPTEVTLDVNGLSRRALVYSPSKTSPKEGSPVVFGFHGHGGSMQNAARSFQMHVHWPEAVVVYMQGLPTSGRTDPEGTRAGWQVASGLYEDRDLKFFDAMFAKVKAGRAIDSKRVYAMGHSNGGRFTYLLWAERASVFAAFGPSGSPATGLLYRMGPKPAFVVAGETDQIVPFSGQKATMDALIEKAECGKEGKKDGLLTTYASKTGNEIQTYIVPGGHAYPRQANPLMVEFFKRQTLRRTN